MEPLVAPSTRVPVPIRRSNRAVAHKRRSRWLWILSVWVAVAAQSATVFIEAEKFTPSSNGWKIVTGAGSREASGLAFLSGASGAPDDVASATVHIKDAGRYHVWVRYSSHPTYRGPFRVSAIAGGRELGGAVFDAEFEGKTVRDKLTWRSFVADLPEGEVTLRLSKHGNQNCSYLARLVDCLLLTMDAKQVPNHLHYGVQTYLRVTIGDGYERPVYIHVFADHYHPPWYQHYSLARDGATAKLAPAKQNLLKSGERTPWCNISPMLYQDSGAILNITARHGYTERAERLRATFEFATAPEEKSVVRTVRADCRPNGLVIVMPPNLATPENLARFKLDREVAEETGKIADSFPWPRHGKKLERFPFFVTARLGGYGTPVDAAVEARERKTLDYFGFMPKRHREIRGVWFMLNGSYCQPDLDKMKQRAAARKRGQIIGHHLIAHAGRKPWDIKLKATSELACGVKILNSFFYGLSWGSHEGGPLWQSSAWYANAQTWAANASLTCEVGAVEDLLLSAMPAPAKVAILHCRLRRWRPPLRSFPECTPVLLTRGANGGKGSLRHEKAFPTVLVAVYGVCGSGRGQTFWRHRTRHIVGDAVLRAGQPTGGSDGDDRRRRPRQRTGRSACRRPDPALAHYARQTRGRTARQRSGAASQQTQHTGRTAGTGESEPQFSARRFQRAAPWRAGDRALELCAPSAPGMVR